jgi:L-threonylcarbamoyladenylate synthase
MTPPLPRFAADAAGLAAAAAVLRAGGQVAFPTETVYGLGADARDDRAVAGIYAAKGRPSFNPLIVHLADVETARQVARFDDRAERLAAAFWPGPLTLVLPLREGAGISALVTAGLPTVALRVPAHPVARALLAATANPSGRVSPTTADHVAAGLAGRIGGVVDGGACGVGVESTIIGLDGPASLLRAGGVPPEAVEAVLGVALVAGGDAGAPTAPGQLLSHYAPTGRLRLNATAALPGEVMVGFGAVPGELTLSAAGDLTEAAANLFAILHRLDAMGAAAIAMAPVPETGLGRAINDRLRRAAAPRENF